MQNLQKLLFRAAGVFAAMVCLLDTAPAQAGTLTANPTQFTFNAQNGVTPAPQTLMITSTTGPTKVTISAFSNTNWLMVSPAGGTTPLSVTVSVNPALSKLAQDFGFINISSSTTFVPPIVVELNSSGNPVGPAEITANPGSLNFNFPANSTIPLSKNVALSSGNSSVTMFTASATTNDGGHWITLNPTSGTLPDMLQVTVNPTALSGSGPFSAAVAIAPPGSSGTTVQVTVTIGGVPTIQTSASQLNFVWQLGTAGPAAQMVSITSTGSPLSFSASATTSSCGNWLVVSPATGVTPGIVTAEVNTSVLATAQSCTGGIQITAPGASNPSLTIPVSLLVSANPLLLAPSTGPAFSYQLGTSTQLAPQHVQITSSSAALNFTASAAPTTAGGPNFLAVSPTAGTTPQSLALTVKPGVLAGLGPGTYSETVTLTSSGAGNSPQTFPVTLTVNSNPLLTASVASLSFTHEIGQGTPPSQTFTVSSTGSPVNFQVSATASNCAGFLSAVANGGNPALTYGDQNQVVASVDVKGIKAGTCKGNIKVSVPNSSTPALNIPETLDVSDKALLNVSTNALNITLLAGAGPATQNVAVTSTDSSVLTFSATAATDPIGLTWLSVAPNSANTPTNLLVTINPANLEVGTYDGSIMVSTPNLPSQTIHAKLTVVASNISANPTSLTLTQASGATAVSQNVQINGIPTGTTIGAQATTFNGTGWLSASVAGSTVMVTADAAHLQQGLYSGVVTALAPGAGNSPLYIPVTFTVTAANSLSLSLSSLPLVFQIGGTLPTAPAVQVTSSVPGVPFAAEFIPSSGGLFLSVAPTTGVTPGTLTLTLNPGVVGTLGVGTYSGSVVVSSPNIPGGNQTINVSLTVSPAPGAAIISLANAASLAPGPVAPGELISIFGTNLGPATGIGFTPDNGRVDTTLGGTMVLFNNTPAPLLYVSATQINAIVPYEVASFALVSISVSRGGAASTPLALTVTDTAPGIFSANETGNGQGAILNQNLSPNSARNPAPKGSIVAIYLTGEGALSPAGITGAISGPSLPLPVPIAHVSVTIGGQPAVISYAGEAPGLVSGVLQVNAKIPENIPSGNQLVLLTIGNSNNIQQAITIAVQ